MMRRIDTRIACPDYSGTLVVQIPTLCRDGSMLLAQHTGEKISTSLRSLSFYNFLEQKIKSAIISFPILSGQAIRVISVSIHRTKFFAKQKTSFHQ